MSISMSSDEGRSVTGSGSVTALNASIDASTVSVAAETVIFSVTGTFVATLLLEGTVDGTNWSTITGLFYPVGSVTTAITSVGAIVIKTSGLAGVRMRASAYTSGTASVAWCAGPGSNQDPVRLLDAAGQGLTSTTLGTHQRIDTNTTISSPAGLEANLFAQVSAFNRLQVTPEPSTLLTDKFDSTLNTVNWTAIVTGTATAATATGGLALVNGIVANNTSRIVSNSTFMQGANVTMRFGVNVAINAATVTGAHRFWGFGTSASNTAAAPLTDAVGFEVDTTGALNAVVWAGGTKIASTAITRPTDGLNHRYTVDWRTDKIAFYLDDTEIPDAIHLYQIPQVQTLPFRIHSFNSAVVSAAPTLTSPAVGISDAGRNSTGISDGTYGFRKAVVDEFGHLNVGMQNNYLRLVGNATTTVKSGTGILHGYQVGNDNENALYTFYDNTAASGTIILTHTTGSPSGGLLSTSGQRGGSFVGGLDIRFNTGLTVVRTGGTNSSLTIIYR